MALTKKKKIRVLFFWPGIGDGYPLGIPILQSIVKRKGHEALVFSSGKYHSIPRSSRGLLYKSSDSKDLRPDKNEYMQAFAEGSNDFKKTVAKFKPDVIGMAVFSTNFLIGMAYYKSLPKKLRPFLLVGGVHSTLTPNETLEEDEIDAICVGEGELMMEGFLDKCETGSLDSRDFVDVPNLWHKGKNGEIIKNQTGFIADIEELPLPDMAGFGIKSKHFVGKKYRYISIELSRGCPMHCAYCCNDVYKKAVFGENRVKIRRMEPKTAIDRMIALKSMYEIEMFRFSDENFTATTIGWLKTFCVLYKQSIGLPFTISATASSLNAEKVMLIKDAGCVNANMGPESGNDDYRKTILRKKETDDMYIKARRLFEDYDIRVNANFLYGLPFQTEEVIQDTINFIKKLNCPISTEFFVPLPGSELYEKIVDMGIYKGLETDYDCYRSFGEPVFIPDEKTREDVIAQGRTMILYAKLPKSLNPIIKACEKESDDTNRILDVLDLIFAV